MRCDPEGPQFSSMSPLHGLRQATLGIIWKHHWVTLQNCSKNIYCVTPLLKSLHGLPVSAQIQRTFLMFTLHNPGIPYVSTFLSCGLYCFCSCHPQLFLFFSQIIPPFLPYCPLCPDASCKKNASCFKSVINL